VQHKEPKRTKSVESFQLKLRVRMAPDMFARLRTFWRNLRSSLWALPLLMVIAAAVAAIFAVRFSITQGEDPVWFLYSGGAEQAPQFLSNLVTAMITMATLVVSITIVVLTLAAQQLGPRLIRSFMSDRRTQITLGLFTATVVYLLLVLRSTYGDTDSVPNLAVTIGTALVLLCLLALLVFVHHLARSIIADTTIDRVGETLDSDVERLLPKSDFREQPIPAETPREDGMALKLHGCGYVQAVDYKRLTSIAADADAAIELAIKPGDHVVAGGIFAWVTPVHVADDNLRETLEECLVFARARDSADDLLTSIRQLVEVALRALSPSINDPHTAMAAIDRLTESLSKMMRRGSPKRVWRDDEGRVRLITARSDFPDWLDAAFRQIRQHAIAHPAVLTRVVEGLGKLLVQANELQRHALISQIDIVLATARRAIEQSDDLAPLEKAARNALPGEVPLIKRRKQTAVQ
jgi:uncharacterized membrane protein